MKLDPQSNILHLDTSEVPLKQMSLQQGRLLLKFLWVFQTNVDLFFGAVSKWIFNLHAFTAVIVL